MSPPLFPLHGNDDKVLCDASGVAVVCLRFTHVASHKTSSFSGHPGYPWRNATQTHQPPPSPGDPGLPFYMISIVLCRFRRCYSLDTARHSCMPSVLFFYCPFPWPCPVDATRRDAVSSCGGLCGASYGSLLAMLRDFPTQKLQLQWGRRGCKIKFHPHRA